MLTFKIIVNFKKIIQYINSNYLSHSISRLNSVDLIKEKINNSSFQKILSIGRYFHLLFDNKNLYNFEKKKIDLLIVSNLVNLNINQDYYFGNLEKILKKKNISCIKVLRNLSNEKTKVFFKFKKKILTCYLKETKYLMNTNMYISF